jgi:hypothetical protein
VVVLGVFDEKFHCGWLTNSKKSKGGGGRSLWAIYRRAISCRGARVCHGGDQAVGVSAVHGQGSPQRRKAIPIGGAHLSVEGGGEREYPFGIEPCWAVGLFWGWAEWLPLAFLSFLDFFFIFFFMFSVFISNFCKNASNQFELLSIIF